MEPKQYCTIKGAYRPTQYTILDVTAEGFRVCKRFASWTDAPISFLLPRSEVGQIWAEGGEDYGDDAADQERTYASLREGMH